MDRGRTLESWFAGARAASLIAALAACAVSCASDGDAAASECTPSYIPSAICDEALAMRLPAELPPSRGNRYADDENAAYLGFHMFFDADVGKGVGCPACHAPELAFTDRLPVSVGKGTGTRNSPTTFNAGRMRVIFWDGRADSLWSQPLFAIENSLEMDSSRIELAHVVRTDPVMKQEYETAFGALPDMTTWPAAGKPGDAAFDELPADTKDQVNRLAANVGKAMEAYMRKNSTKAAPLDRFLEGDETAMIVAAQEGLQAFVVHGCPSCHSGSLLSDEDFHNVGFPSLPGAAPDLGRAEGLAVLQDNIFNLAGPYADPGPGVPAEISTEPVEEGAFRTPSLRNVARTAPYGHDGAIPTLREVLALHAPELSEEEQGDVLAFFQTLNGDYPDRPWSNWPSPQ